jgi:hypothetical protein
LQLVHSSPYVRAVAPDAVHVPTRPDQTKPNHTTPRRSRTGTAQSTSA